ncbi:MAG: dockerin type I repeat-containing protein [bacterium]
MRASLCGLLALLTAAMFVAPRQATATCCLCQNCADAPFCVDGIPNSQTCANFCLSVSCGGVVYDSADACSGGCDGAANAPTATPKSTATVTATRTATATQTQTATPTATNASTATASQTASATATASDTATPANTSTPSGTGTVTATPTITATPADTETPTATATVTQTASATPTPELGGQVRYYSNDAPVEGVNVALLGAAPDDVLTDANGFYVFDAPGNDKLSLQPGKHDTVNNAITSLDASYILQVIADLRTFTADQTLAGDVTGDGTLSTLDASLILKFQAGLIEQFPAASPDVCDSDWLFRPDPRPAANQTLVQPVVSGGVCQQGEIGFDPLVPPVAGQDFVAILFGDTTGNWMP